MINIKDITASIDSDLFKFNDALKDSAKSKVDLVNIIIKKAHREGLSKFKK